MIIVDMHAHVSRVDLPCVACLLRDAAMDEEWPPLLVSTSKAKGCRKGKPSVAATWLAKGKGQLLRQESAPAPEATDATMHAWSSDSNSDAMDVGESGRSLGLRPTGRGNRARPGAQSAAASSSGPSGEGFGKGRGLRFVGRGKGVRPGAQSAAAPSSVFAADEA